MNQEMSPLIDTQTMVARIRDYGLSTTNQVVTMMMSGVFATSALAIADIMRTPDDFWVRLTLWLTASLTAIFSMTRQLHGNSLIVHPSPLHVPVQLVVGFLIASSFAFIPLSSGGADGWRYAYVVLLFVPAIAHVSGSLVVNNTRPEFFSAELRAPINRRVESFKRVTRGTPIFLLFYGTGVAAAWVSWSNPDPWIHVLVGLNVFFVFIGLFGLAIELRSFKALLDDIEAVRVAAPMKDSGKAP